MNPGRYEILGTIGAGATCRVEKARDTIIDRFVAIKKFGNGFTSGELRKQFLREARIVGLLSHPNIVSVYDAGLADDGSPYLVMEYVPGKTLEVVLAEGPLPLARAALCAGDLATALGRAHRAGVVHGDVKPANILISPDGHLKLGDFGVARFAAQVSASGNLVGTPAYLSPEQIRGGSQDARSDIFSLGIVLYQMVTGVRPFDGSSMSAVCAQIVAADPLPPSRHNPALPRELDRIILRCLAKDPARRYPNAESLASSLFPLTCAESPRPAAVTSSLEIRRKIASSVVAAAAAFGLVAAIPVVRPVRSHAAAAAANTPAVQLAAANSGEISSGSPSVLANSYSPVSTARNRAKGIVPSSTARLAASPARSPRSVSASVSAESAAPSIPSASLNIDVTSGVKGETLAIFADQQLLATVPLAETRGQPLHLEKALTAGPHQLRVALYRTDQSLHTQKEGLVEIRDRDANHLLVHVSPHSTLFLKHDAALQVAWPGAPAGAASNGLQAAAAAAAVPK